MFHQLPQAGQLLPQYGTSGVGEFVFFSAAAVRNRKRCDPSLFAQRIERAVQRAGGETDAFAGELFGLLHDAVAVLRRPQGQQNVVGRLG